MKDNKKYEANMKFLAISYAGLIITLIIIMLWN